MKSGQIRSIKIRVSAKVKITGFWGLDCTKSRKIQQILLNLRPVCCSELERVVIRTVTSIYRSQIEKDGISSDKIFFLLYIKSLDSEYNFFVKNGRFTVEFDHLDKIVDSIERIAFRVTQSKHSKRSRVLNQSLVPSPFFRSIGRSLKLKQNRTLLTNRTSHSFENRTIFRKTESRTPAAMKQGTGQNENVNSNKEDVQRQTPMDCYNVSDELPIDRKCTEKSIENWRCDTGKPISQGGSVDAISPVKESENENSTATRMSHNFEGAHSSTGEVSLEKRNPNETLTKNICNRDDPDGSRFEDKSTEKLQDSGNHRRISQRINHSLTVKEYQYDNHGVLWISQKCVEKLSNSVEEMYTLNDCSQWSDWIYEPESANCNEVPQSGQARPVIFQRFRFLPVHLHALLRYGNAKMIDKISPEMNGVTTDRHNRNSKYRRQDLEVRPCIRRSFEVRLSPEALQSMKVNIFIFVNNVNC